MALSPERSDTFDAAELTAAPMEALQRRLEARSERLARSGALMDLLMRTSAMHSEAISRTHGKRSKASFDRMSEIIDGMTPDTILDAWRAYVVDAAQRAVLTMDTLRERGDIFLEHEAAGCPPVLIYDYEVVLDGADLPRPSNYVLLRIIPPEGVEVRQDKRPYIIIDPRAGHGGGIGGFKPDSQVGVALKDGHPVYFVNFKRDPEPGQVLADVTRSEAAFVRKVMELHPDSPKPVVTGNCQGGWATLLLAATNRDIVGPIVLNGAPVAPWSGEVGKNPMRYNAGVLGGTWIPMFLSDLGGGVFDGANLVMNFEMLNPSRTMFRKYTDLYETVDDGRERFLEFERWWGGYFLMNEAEIRWIVENLFVGNKLTRNMAQLEPGRSVDVSKVEAPIIVFASHGDNITPPQQALNWIIDSYTDEQEIQIRGQRIVYMVHEEVGHLGIFVSSSIAKKEHTEVTSTLKTIEALAPGLYEMKIDKVEGEGQDKSFLVSFHARTFDDIRAVDDGRSDERPFAAVARFSEIQAELYDIAMRPFVKSMVTPESAKALRRFHPMRFQRELMSSANPWMQMATAFAATVKERRQRAEPDNPFVQLEKTWFELVGQLIDMGRDVRDAGYEETFFALWGTPWADRFGAPRYAARTLKTHEELRGLPAVKTALRQIARGGFVEAVIRMLVLMADSRHSVRRDRLERSARVMTQDEPFKSLTMECKAQMIHEQTLVATFEPDRALETLPELLIEPEERRLAVDAVSFIAGPLAEMAPHTVTLLESFRKTLGLEGQPSDVTEDPLAHLTAGAPLVTAAE
ncbi:alpha/beta hydrolase [Marinibacterium profundimaris]|uniref:Alpha/beta hydrolase n=1 Tax=Marinibacterium profundimaris TaxID=1679460 RepID=A0A225NKP7_9RHOB|nr:alpha/beta hydrolase [Marinibacterium profundimaris]